MKQDDQQFINHIHRIKGQLDGVERMVQDCRNCDEVIIQLMAARSSIEQITLKLLQEETDSCLRSSSKKDMQRLNKVASTILKYT